MTSPADMEVSRGELREEAASWFALLRGPDADAHREEFEAWLSRGPTHREAYNRIAETFSLGKALRYEDLPAAGEAPSSPAILPLGRRRAMAAALMTIVAVFALAMAWLSLSGGAGLSTRQTARERLAEGGAAPLRYATQTGEIRPFRLADGSVATLDTNSVVTVQFDAGRRLLTLVKGRARFEVVHERRPFIVAANGGSVTAVGTVFDVKLGNGGRIDVRLLKGVIDVAPGARSGSDGAVRRLSAGQEMSFGATASPSVAKIGGAIDANWPQGLRDFNAVRLADVLVEANRYGTLKVSTVGPGVADLRISGTFRVDDPRQLASNIAEVLRLALVTKDGEVELMRDCPAAAKINCEPPS